MNILRHLHPTSRNQDFLDDQLRSASIDPFDQDLGRRVALFVQQKQLTAGARLQIEAHRGVVTLSGTVGTFHQRQLLYSFARRVAGVVQVQDQLEVAPAAAL